MGRHQPGWWHPLRQGILLIDAVVRRVSGYEEFTRDPECIFRVLWSRAPYDYTFVDGTHVPEGATVLVLHFWNERIPPMPPTGPDMQWALRFYQLLRHSLVLLADYVHVHPRGREVQALYGRIFLDVREGEPGLKLLQRLGFELKPVSPPNSWLARVGYVIVQSYAHALAWAFNPGSVRQRSTFQKQLTDVWMSRRALLTYQPSSDSLDRERTH